MAFPKSAKARRLFAPISSPKTRKVVALYYGGHNASKRTAGKKLEQKTLDTTPLTTFGMGKQSAKRRRLKVTRATLHLG